LLMQVKICGITNVEDALLAEEAGADYLGLVFIERKGGVRSKRFVPIDNAKVILQSLKATTSGVGLFQNHPVEYVSEAINHLDLRVVQLHGEESAGYVNQILHQCPSCRVIKAFTVSDAQSIQAMTTYYGQISRKDGIEAFLLDSPGGGGTGERFDWSKIVQPLDQARKNLPRLFLAGGLTVENVREAISILQPDGVDVSSGVEASPGRKDPAKVREFIRRSKS